MEAAHAHAHDVAHPTHEGTSTDGRTRNDAIHTRGLTLVEPATTATISPKVERAEIRAVLTRAAADPSFIAQLTYAPSAALEPYRLTQEARAALASGDIRWIEAHAGKLDARLRTWLDCRLQQEIW